MPLAVVVVLAVLLWLIIRGTQKDTLYVAMIVPIKGGTYRAHYSIDTQQDGRKVTLCYSATWMPKARKWANGIGHVCYAPDWVGDQLSIETQRFINTQQLVENGDTPIGNKGDTDTTTPRNPTS